MDAMTSSNVTTQQNGKLDNMVFRPWSIRHTCFELPTDSCLRIVPQTSILDHWVITLKRCFLDGLAWSLTQERSVSIHQWELQNNCFSIFIQWKCMSFKKLKNVWEHAVATFKQTRPRMRAYGIGPKLLESLEFLRLSPSSHTWPFGT